MKNNVIKSANGFFSGIIHSIADYTREINKLLFILCIAASLFGCALIYSATRYSGQTRTFTVQFIAVLISVVVAVAVSMFDYKTLTRFPIIYFAAGAALLVITYFFGYAPEGTENKAWIELPYGMSIQVSELIKIFMVLTFSAHVQKIPSDEINRPKNIILLGIHAVAPPAAVMVLQKDLGTVTIMLCIALFMLYAAGIKARYFVIGFAGIAASAPFVWYFGLSEYMRQRFEIILDLESDPKGLGYQQLQGLNSIGSGGIFGEGYLHGTYTQSGLPPKAYNDFILAVAGNEFGFIGCVAVVALLAAIIIRIMQIGIGARDVQGKIICFGVFGMFAAQILINVGMVLALLPVIGVTLPFFSAGGSSLVVLYVSVGIVQSVYKNRFKRTVQLHG